MNRPELNPGETYAGILLGKDDAADQHLILLPGEAAALPWDKAIEWAREAGGELPSRREQAILFGNLPEQFQKDWYWSGEQHAAGAGYAWSQDFYDGDQDDFSTNSTLRARAVRRLEI